MTGSDRPGTVNDLLLAALHVAIDGRNQEHGATAQKIGTMVPINMRPEERRQEVMANLLLPVRVVTNRSHRATPGRVQETVRAQTRRFKEMDSGAALIELLNRSPALPLGAKEALSPLLWLTGNRLVDTAMLSNLGRLERPPTFGPEAGDTTEVWFSAPARIPLGLSLGAVTVAGRLHLAFRYRHALLDHEAAARFADRYLSVLMSMVSQ
ncbi:MAG TPA: hypothetical protein VK988_06385 [Acidimicrobiales bacterium]|nr:hypothetical protein [Acidimicrobiales bacterium]